MTEDELGFLQAMLAAPGDMDTLLVYADWLEDRADPRAEYLRLWVELVTAPADHFDGLVVRQRMNTLRPEISADWLALLGDFRCNISEAWNAPSGAELVANHLGRPVSRVDENGYTCEITAGTVQGVTDALAYVECISRQIRADYLDIQYYLRLRHRGREVSCVPKTYNPYFGCSVHFLEWIGDGVLMIYREKHRDYACRFGFDIPEKFEKIDGYWLLDGLQLAYWEYRGSMIRRLTIPTLEPLPPLSAEEATARDLLPPRGWE